MWCRCDGGIENVGGDENRYHLSTMAAGWSLTATVLRYYFQTDHNGN